MHSRGEQRKVRLEGILKVTAVSAVVEVSLELRTQGKIWLAADILLLSLLERNYLLQAAQIINFDTTCR